MLKITDFSQNEIAEMPKKIQQMIPASRYASLIMHELMEIAKPGVSTLEIDQVGKKLCDKYGVESLAFGQVGSRNIKFPGYVCVSINDEVTHVAGRADQIIKEGDLVKIDVAVSKDGFAGDNCIAFVAGRKLDYEELLTADDSYFEKLNENREAIRLIAGAYSALRIAIDTGKVGVKVGDISNAIESEAERWGYSPIRDLCGHTIGKDMWEDPLIPNFGRPNTGKQLSRYHTIAMDTMINEGDWRLKFDQVDGWTVRTKDGKLSAVFEETFFVYDEHGVILTVP